MTALNRVSRKFDDNFFVNIKNPLLEIKTLKLFEKIQNNIKSAQLRLDNNNQALPRKNCCTRLISNLLNYEVSIKECEIESEIINLNLYIYNLNDILNRLTKLFRIIKSSDILTNSEKASQAKKRYDHLHNKYKEIYDEFNNREFFHNNLKELYLDLSNSLSEIERKVNTNLFNEYVSILNRRLNFTHSKQYEKHSNICNLKKKIVFTELKSTINLHINVINSLNVRPSNIRNLDSQMSRKYFMKHQASIIQQFELHHRYYFIKNHIKKLNEIFKRFYKIIIFSNTNNSSWFSQLCFKIIYPNHSNNNSIYQLNEYFINFKGEFTDKIMLFNDLNSAHHIEQELKEQNLKQKERSLDLNTINFPKRLSIPYSIRLISVQDMNNVSENTKYFIDAAFRAIRNRNIKILTLINNEINNCMLYKSISEDTIELLKNNVNNLKNSHLHFEQNYLILGFIYQFINKPEIAEMLSSLSERLSKGEEQLTWLNESYKGYSAAKKWKKSHEVAIKLSNQITNREDASKYQPNLDPVGNISNPRLNYKSHSFEIPQNINRFFPFNSTTENIYDLPPLPNNFNEILNKPCPIFNGYKVFQTHLLMGIPQKVNGIDYSLNSFEMNLQERDLGLRFGWKSPYIDSIWENGVSHSYWVLITKRPINGTNLHNMLRAEIELPDSYEVPTILEMGTYILARNHNRSTEASISSFCHESFCNHHSYIKSTKGTITISYLHKLSRHSHVELHAVRRIY